MKKLIILVITGLFLTTSTAALAQDPAGQVSVGQNAAGQSPAGNAHRCDHARGCSLRALPALEHLLRALRQLNLSDTQKSAIQAIVQVLKTDLAPVGAAMKAGHLQLRELVKADPYDDIAVADVAIQLGDLTAQQVALVSQAIADIFSQLTAGQRAQLDAMTAP